MDLKKVRYLTLTDAARYFETSVDIFCDWLKEHQAQIVASSEFDNGNLHPLYKDSLELLLAAADKRIEQVAFKYPPTLKKRFRPKGTSRFDEQVITLHALRIAVSEVERIKDSVLDDIGGILPENYGLKKVRRTGQKWVKLHRHILSAANELLRENRGLYINKNEKPIVAKLAKAIANEIRKNKTRWPELSVASTGVTERNFVEKLGKMKDKILVPKK